MSVSCSVCPQDQAGAWHIVMAYKYLLSESKMTNKKENAYLIRVQNNYLVIWEEINLDSNCVL